MNKLILILLFYILLQFRFYTCNALDKEMEKLEIKNEDCNYIFEHLQKKVNFGFKCYENKIHAKKTVNCNWDNDGTDKHEGGRNQTSSIELYENIGVYNNNNTFIVALLQSYQAIPSINQKILVNSKSEHVAYFQVKIDVNNIFAKEIKGLSLNNLYPGEDDNFKYQCLSEMSKTFDIYAKAKMREWAIISYGQSEYSMWSVYQVKPFNSIENTPDNFYSLWLRKIAPKDYRHNLKRILKDSLPNQSIDSNSGCLLSVFYLAANQGIVELETTVLHTLGDLVIGSFFDHHNSYRTVEYGKTVKKYFDTTTGEVYIGKQEDKYQTSES